MERILDYDIREKVSDSRNSVVYRTGSPLTGIDVILKVFKAERPSPPAIARFVRGCDALRRAEVQGVVRIFEVLNLDGKIGLVLEDFPGVSLGKLLRDSRLPLKKVLEIGIALARTLEDLHRKGIIHGNIKPDNILVDPRTSEVKLTDFGMAREITNEDRDLSHPEVVEGYLPYISPEQTGWTGHDIDAGTDYYSLGVTLYRMLTGRLPFLAVDPLEIMHAHMVQVPVSPSAITRNVPAGVSAIIMKLLAKEAPDRYLSGHGLACDLRECLEQYSRSGRVEPFAIAGQDREISFRIPQRIVGRQGEVQRLKSGFEEASRGGRKVLLVKGGAGVGKSALVHEIRRTVMGAGGAFASGEFDRFRGSVPCSALIQAFGKLGAGLITGSRERIMAWRNELLEALSGSGRVITDAMPFMEPVLGKQPALAELGPGENRTRFHAAFAGLVKAFVHGFHPLVLFLDNLQWADPASLELLSHLATHPGLSHLFLVGAFRDDEAGPSHPLVSVVEGIRAAGTPVDEITLDPLCEGDVISFISLVLRCPEGDAAPLGHALWEKTGGNPFFMGQIVQSLYKEGLVSPDPRRGLVWGAEAVARVKAPESPMDLIELTISLLDWEPEKLLEICACIGNRFDLETLSIIMNKPLGETLELLESLIEGGLVRYQGGELYRFAHDGVQEAVYERIPEGRRRELHYRIGKLVYENTPTRRMLEKVYYVAGQLNLGMSLIQSPDERIDLVRLNLIAARKAKQSSACQAAVAYLDAAMKLMPARGFKEHHELAMILSCEMAQGLYLIKEFEKGSGIFSMLMKNARTGEEAASVCRCAVEVKTSVGRPAEALQDGLGCLRKLGVKVRGGGSLEDLPWAEMESLAQGEEAGLDHLVDIGPSEGPERDAVLRLLTATARAGSLSEESHEPGSCQGRALMNPGMGALRDHLCAMAGEGAEGSLLEKILDAAVELSGARIGCLLLRNGAGKLHIAARHDREGHARACDVPVPPESDRDIPLAVVSRVGDTNARIVVNDASSLVAVSSALKDGLDIRGMKSLLCLPIGTTPASRQRPAGVLYLESSALADAFTQDRVEMVEIVCLFAACRLEAWRHAPGCGSEVW